MLELRERCKKEYYHHFQRWMHYLMLYVTRPLLYTSVTPNQITVFWLLLQLVGSGFMIFGEYRWNVIGVVIYTFAMLLDYVDGQIARIKKIHSLRGIYLEDLGIYLGSPIFMICFAIGVSKNLGNISFLYLGIISALAILLSKLIVINPLNYPIQFQEELAQLRKRSSTRVQNRFLALAGLSVRRSQPLNLLFFGIVFNVPQYTLILYTGLYVLEFFRKLYLQVRTLSHLDSELKP